ncbi:LOW QUALITY PROTEIN: hypothetical protein V1478_018067 [Vespula squamosa]|uniref:Uncharacterized protein n=1 Tax=Vespula squamosa TaxID=30214 RepID=A0ABD1ZVZ7_VESSQ
MANTYSNTLECQMELGWLICNTSRKAEQLADQLMCKAGITHNISLKWICIIDNDLTHTLIVISGSFQFSTSCFSSDSIIDMALLVSNIIFFFNINSTNILERKHSNIFLMCLIKRILKICLLPSEKGRYKTFRRNIKGFWEHTCGTLTMSREFFHSTINLNYVSYLKCYKWGISVNNLSNLITREKEKKICSDLLIRNYHHYNQSHLKIHSTLDISELIHNNCY